MRRRIENPRIILLDCTLEYKKGESMTNMELTKEDQFAIALEQERREMKAVCDYIIKFKPDVVITEKRSFRYGYNLFNYLYLTMA